MIPATPDQALARIKAETLIESLDWLREFHGRIVVVKFGGNAMGDDAAMAEFARDIVLMRQVGVNPVVVHGGGPQIDEALRRIGKQGTFIQGMRVTDADTMEVVEWVLLKFRVGLPNILS